MQVFLFNYWYNVDTPFASAIEDREYSFFQKKKKHHKEVDLDLNEDLLFCVVIMSYGGYYDAYPIWSLCYRGATTPPTWQREISTYHNIVILAMWSSCHKSYSNAYIVVSKIIKEIDSICVNQEKHQSKQD